MRKIVIMAGAAMLLAAPAFAFPVGGGEGSIPSATESMTGGSSSSVGSNGAYSSNAYAGSASSIGVENDHFSSYGTNDTYTNVQPVDGNQTTVEEISNVGTNTTGSDEIEGGSTQSYGGETGGAAFSASGSESGSVSGFFGNPNASP